jgi:hypothetical protein
MVKFRSSLSDLTSRLNAADITVRSKVILPYEPGYTGHWEMEKRRKETREWLREREQQVMRDRIDAPPIVPQSEAVVVTGPEKNHTR